MTWCVDYTVRDVYRKYEHQTLEPIIDDIPKFYAFAIQMMALDPVPITQYDRNASIRDALSDFLYEMYGRPKWFVDKELFELLGSISVTSDDLTGIVFPHDVFTLVFETGCECDGIPIRSIRVCNKSATMTDKFMRQLGMPYDLKSDLVNIMLDSGENNVTGKIAHDTLPIHGRKWNLSRSRAAGDIDDPAFKHSLNDSEREAMRQASRIVLSALLYKNARPDLVVDYKLPRSQRYEYRGDARTYRRVLAPTPLRRTSTQSEPTGRTVRGHYRGWVLRTLRDERYSRNPDGSLKTVLIEPVAVKGGPVRETVND